jgi:hypothetical protein
MRDDGCHKHKDICDHSAGGGRLGPDNVSVPCRRRGCHTTMNRYAVKWLHEGAWTITLSGHVPTEGASDRDADLVGVACGPLLATATTKARAITVPPPSTLPTTLSGTTEEEGAATSTSGPKSEEEALTSTEGVATTMTLSGVAGSVAAATEMVSSNSSQNDLSRQAD